MISNLIKRSFVLGEEWIYYKFYCGAKTADKVLVDVIKPTTELLISNNLIDKWFFIRYSDPDLHLRVRLHCTSVDNLGAIIRMMYLQAEPLVNQELIWKIQLDTYQREIERYGIHTMELSEQLFFLESELFVHVLPLFRGVEGEMHRWHFALRCVDSLLDCFQYSLSDKLRLLRELKDSFGNEFGMNRFLKNQLDAKYAIVRKELEDSLSAIAVENDVVNCRSWSQSHKEKIEFIVKRILKCSSDGILEISIDDLIKSYIHMTMNRMFKSKQRLHEMVLYDFLYRYYKSTNARLVIVPKAELIARKFGM